MRSEPWPQDQTEELRRLAAAGKTGAEIARALGKTRSAILGRCNRLGISLPMDERKRLMLGRYPRRPTATKADKPRREGPSRRGRQRGQRGYTDTQIATAIAGRLAGLSYPKAAALIGASPQSLFKNWMKDPALMAQGRALYEFARQDAAERAERARIARQEAAEAEWRRVVETNTPILLRMPERHAAICRLMIAGHTLQSVGDRFGVSRERVRQILVRWRVEGLIVPGAAPLNMTATNRLLARLHVAPGRAMANERERRGRRRRALMLDARVQAEYA